MINCQESQSSFINGPNCYCFPIRTDSHNLPFQKFCTAIASCICRHTIYISQYTLLIIILYDCARTFILYTFHCFFWGGHSQPPMRVSAYFFWLGPGLPCPFVRQVARPVPSFPCGGCSLKVEVVDAMPHWQMKEGRRFLLVGFI